jgi:outer membrane cobalamin receptor
LAIGGVTGGVWVEKNSDFDAECAAVVEARVPVGTVGSFYAKADRSFGFPRFEMLYWRGPLEGPDGRVGTERSLGMEIGFENDSGPLSTRLTGYWHAVDGMSAWRIDTECMPDLIFEAESEVRGMEITGNYEHSGWLDAAVSYSARWTADESGRELENVPEHVVGWVLRARKRLTRHVTIRLSFAGRWTSDRSGGSRFIPCTGDVECVEDTRLPGYKTGILACAMTLDRATVFVRARNVFNGRVEAFWGRPPLPGRVYEFGLSWDMID